MVWNIAIVHKILISRIPRRPGCTTSDGVKIGQTLLDILSIIKRQIKCFECLNGQTVNFGLDG